MTTQQVAVQEAKKLASELKSKACLVSRPTISYPSGKMTLKEFESSNLTDGTVVDSDEINASLQWFPSKMLQAFNTQRKQAYDLFDACSVTVGAFNLVPIEKLQDVMLKLDEKRIKYLNEVSSTLANYDLIVEQHCKDLGNGKKPKSQAVINLIKKAAALNEFDFKDVFGFEVFPAMAIQPLFEEDEVVMQQKASQSLWEETAKAASEHLKATFNSDSTSKPTARSINGLSRIRDKLIALSFLHDGIDRVIDCCDQVIQAMPKTGKLSDHEILVFTHFMTSVSNVDTLKATAEGDENNGFDMTKVFKMLLPEVVEETEVVEVTDTPASLQFSEEQPFSSPSNIDDSWNNHMTSIPSQSNIELDWGSF